MPISIRAALESDYEAVNTLFTEELAYHIKLKPDIFQMADPVMTKAWYADELAKENTSMLIAEENQAVVGLIAIFVRNNPEDPIFKTRRYTHIEDVIVARTHRGRGIGRRLMVAAQEWAVTQSATAIDLWVWEENDAAIGFYNHLGYKTVRRVMQHKLDYDREGDEG